MKNNNKESKRGNVSGIIPMIIFILIGAFCGVFGSRMLNDIKIMSVNGIFLLIGLLILVLFSIYLQLIVHEAGHLVCGLMSGYEFVSFRIGKFMILKSGNSLKLKKYNVVGTGGQCLMMPPSEENFPYILYNMGGSMGNVLLALICLLIYLLFYDNIYVSSLAIMNCAIGIGIAIINGLPMKISGLANDGYNAISLGKNEEAREDFKLQLQLNSLISRGVRLKDMPEEWFKFPDENLDNPIVCNTAALVCAYYHDKKDFDKARELTRYLLDYVPNMIEVQKNELRCELLFYEIINECDKNEIDRIYNKSLQKYVKQTLGYVSRRRLLYTYELLVNKNKDAAKNQLEKFQKIAKTYPYTGEIRAELENIEYVDKLCQ